MTQLKKFFQEDKDFRIDFYKENYYQLHKSWPEIAKMLNTYTNKVSRDATKLGIKTRPKSEAQTIALSNGNATHPTKGKKRTEQEKEKISETMSENWNNLPEKEKEKRAIKSKEIWEDKSEEEKEKFRKASIKAIHETSKTGSKLEKYILKGLIKNGYNVSFHKEQFTKREKLQIDLLLPELKIAIEIDGPSHFKNVWGEKALEKTKKSDEMKNGLIIGMGYTLIRVRQTKKLSQKYQKDILKMLIETIEKIKNSHYSEVIYI